MARRWTPLILSGLACAMVARAQTSQTAGAIRGVVAAKDGNFIQAGHVTIRNAETGYTRTAELDGLGYYAIPLVPVGHYQVSVKAPGFKSAEGHTRISLGENTVLNMDLDREVASATVEIIGEASAVDTKQVNVMASIDAEVVEAVPLVTRNFTDLARLTPGVVAGAGTPARLISEGGRQIFNGIMIDGANTNSAFFGEQRGAAYQPFTFALDTVRELQIVTNGFDAQYGSAGASINAVTKGGTNDFGGSAIVEFRRNSWTAKSKPVPYDPGALATPANPFNVDKNLTRTNDSKNIGVTFGGPIVKDKLFFFLGGEQFKKDVTAQPPLATTSSAAGFTTADFTALSTSPLASVILNSSGATILQEFGNPLTGTLPRAYNLYSDNKVLFGRLDYNLNEFHRFVLRLNYTSLKDVLLQTSNSPNNAESFLLTTPGLSTVSWVLESNNIWTPNLFTESHLQIANERRPFRGNSTGGPAVRLFIPPGNPAQFNLGSKTSSPRESNEVATQLLSTTTWLRGDWTFKGGVDYVKSDVDNQFFNNGQGLIQFGDYKSAADWANNTVVAGDKISYAGAVSDTRGRIQMWTRTFSGFLNAQYQGFLSKRLTLNAGVRYTTQAFSDNPFPNPSLKGLDKGFGGNATDPRFGFSFDVDGKGKTVVRGGYGYFSSPTPLLLHSNTMTGNGKLITNYSAGSLTALDASNVGLFQGNGPIAAGTMIQGSGLVKVTDAALGALVAGATDTSIWDPDSHLSLAKKASLGTDHDFGDGLVVGISATYTLYEHLQYFQNINLNQGAVAGALVNGFGPSAAYNDGYADPNLNRWSTGGGGLFRPNSATVRGRYLDFRSRAFNPDNPTTGFGNVYLVKTDGFGRYRGLTFKVEKKWNENAGFQGNLTFSKAEDTSSFERGTWSSGSLGDPYSELGASLSSNPNRIGATFGPSNNDRFMVLNAVAYHPAPWGLKVSWRFLYQTGLPYSPFTQQTAAPATGSAPDGSPNGDGMANKLAYGSRNSIRQDDEKQIDLRLSRVFKLVGKLQIEGIIDVYNIFNWQTPYVDANIGQGLPGQSGASTFATDATGTRKPGFGKATIPAQNTRELQVGIRMKF